MVATPFVIAFTIPVDEPMITTVMSELLHVPPVVALVRVAVDDAQSDVAPAIADGNGYAVTTIVAIPPEKE
jgi:hypothetical protein